MAKKKDKTLYTDDSIVTLNPRDFTRLRPSTYLGSNEYSTQLVREVFSNSLDEVLIGHGNNITVEINTHQNIYRVDDLGQGFPINVVKDGKTVLQAAFDTINTSGKYTNDGVYGGVSLGTNGIGSKLTNFLSKWLEVVSYNADGEYEHIRFEDGIFKWRQTGKASRGSGTIVTWEPDPQFFQNPSANMNDLRKLFQDIAGLCPELTINFKVDGKDEVFHSANGLNDLLDVKVKNKELLQNRFSCHKVDGAQSFDLVLTYTSDYSENITAYVNYGLTDSGIHISTLKSLFTKLINRYVTDVGLIKKEADEFSSAELAEGFTVIFNLKTTDVSYDSQTKSRVVDLNRSLLTSTLRSELPAWLLNNTKEAKLIIDRALNARKAKEAAQNAKERIRNASGKGKKFISLPTKLVDAWSKDRSECELFITEGDSAANGLIAKRNGKTQAVFPIRGKILSCRKASMDKIYANQEISNIVKALGLDINKENGKLIYNQKKLRYGKIIFACDADPDGLAIRLLLLNAFWWLCPELVENGHIYVAIPPLYRITDKNNNYIYLTDDAELSDYKKKHKTGYLINRNKGLGEQSPDELSECLLKEATRNVQQIVSTSFKDTDDMLECFMGQDVKIRRDYLLGHYNEVDVTIE
ncbi:MAG: hypothetical protein IJH65_03875 [Methanobrevibacter sp.]|nr:hypothetical protein [Methanobrevibacter sp.]